jgi:uncharacterized protein YjbI with pentapeptide repeats
MNLAMGSFGPHQRNAEHARILLKGAADWNAWRADNPSVAPGLGGFDFSGTDLRGANLRTAFLFQANLERTDLRDADLTSADLQAASLNGTLLDGASLVEANLVVAKLSGLDLTRADLRGAGMRGTDLRDTNLSGAALRSVDLRGAHLARSNLTKAVLRKADMRRANLDSANLTCADLTMANLHEAHLNKATLCDAHLGFSDLSSAQFEDALLNGASLNRAQLQRASLERATLASANLEGALLIETNFRQADLSRCRTYGVSAWNIQLEGALQNDLVITARGEPVITVDNIEVAQFVYLLLHNEKLRAVIDTITSKAVLILGRFTLERKAVLDALRDALRQHNYLPILFDFDIPQDRDVTETVMLLARMARFIVADLTEPSSIPKELEAIIPTLAVPVQPLLHGSQRPYSMFRDYWKYDWVLEVHRYEDKHELLAKISDIVISGPELKLRELRARRLGALMAE